MPQGIFLCRYASQLRSLLSLDLVRTSMAKQVHAAHILVKKEDKAKELLTRLSTGESFTELARKYSDCPSGKDGGDLGWFGRGQMVREFEEAAFNGQKGATVGPVRTQFGWHLIKILDQR
jgi:peptidyl-prolyl cis-trans isomerase C